MRSLETHRAGFYTLTNQQKEEHLWVANSPKGDSSQGPLDLDRFQRALALENFVEISPHENIQEKVQEARFGEEIWHIFILLALAGLITEMLIFREQKNVVT